ncbi:acyl-CoA thioester hydrolase/BAAT C-terminal domain-containing protein [Evansella tamaricis]|uniref:Acyl-CoA thioesterase/BAAT N-terminal domain-containing protein n=1 Tax=Evansella tamaricis TaxID=2069301 RepID=A0ABS6JHM3_9BACI|nr:acyl-CoA thioester hydrolase/BAAT C-terminal domain-containing protein [Evansella tamaricis]MBU9713179.1 acyl-CoA thioesterase/BAAT N-terminal domain-containing protein [Evansella tamaricis]
MKCFLYPDIGRVDEPLQMHMDGLKPKEQIIVKLKMEHPSMGIWSSEINTNADANGKLSITNHGKNEFSTLIWNLKPRDNSSAVPFQSSDVTDPIHFHIDMEAVESNRTESRTVTRLFKEDHVSQVNVSTEHFEGSYFYTKGQAKLPTILILGGPNGKKRNDIAALLASQGYGAFTLPYFETYKGTTGLSNVPIEKVNHAMDWLKNHDSTDGKNIILLGISKGAELALLAASKNKGIRGVVAYSPASHVFEGLNKKNSSSSWTENGKSIPYVPFTFTFGRVLNKLVAKVKKTEPSLTTMYNNSLAKYERKGKEDAIIKVENIQGPILLLSGEEDAFWPSALMAEKIVNRLKKKNFNYSVNHSKYKNAGHLFILPFLPATQNMEELYAIGGNPLDNAISGEQAWNETIDFLNYHFPPVELPTEVYPFKTSS